jgi:ferredoxin
MVLPSQVAEHYIHDANFHWLMDSCICRDASGCEDYPVELGCLFLGQAASGINPKLGHRVTKDQALAHMRRCREAGLVHMVGRNKLDQIWLGVGPGERLLTICNCCPCCCLWRVLPSISSRIGDKVTRMPGVSVTVNDRCTGCGTCTGGVCFTDAIQLDGAQAVIGDRCRGCSRCVEICPSNAIEISIEAASVERAIGRISPLVDLS